MKLFNQARKYGAKIAVSVSALVLGVSAHAAGEDPVSTIFASIDLTTIAGAVLLIGVLITGVAMSFKGVDLGKRAIRKV